MQTLVDGIGKVTDAFCNQNLDEEYRDLCRKLTAKLARKRPSPIMRGDPKIWAGGIIYALGQLNFLFDQNQKPHLRAEQISELLGCAKTTVASKGRLIRDLLGLDHFNAEFARKSLLASNPMFWMIQVNGLMYDARQLPKEIQEEAFRKGFIPYVPTDPSKEGES